MFPKKCKIKGCGNKADLGAHIRNISTKKSNKQYIIPACYGCNKRGTKKSPVKFQLQTQIVSAVQCHVKALRVSKKTTSKKALKKSFNPPGRNSSPPEGWKLKPGYRCKKVNGRRKYWTPTGRSSAQRNACTQSKTASKKTLKKSFNPPGRNSSPPEGWKLKPGYRCKKVNGRRKYWTRTGRSSVQRNACSKT
jgi:hypothetical protein